MDSVKAKPQNVTLCCVLYHPHSEEECGPKEGKSRVIDRNWGDAELVFNRGSLSCFQYGGKAGSFPVLFIYIFPQEQQFQVFERQAADLMIPL